MKTQVKIKTFNLDSIFRIIFDNLERRFNMGVDAS